MTPDLNQKITVSIDQLTDILAESAASIANELGKRDKDMAKFVISLLAIYSAEVTQKVSQKYATEEE